MTAGVGTGVAVGATVGVGEAVGSPVGDGDICCGLGDGADDVFPVPVLQPVNSTVNMKKVNSSSITFFVR